MTRSINGVTFLFEKKIKNAEATVKKIEELGGFVVKEFSKKVDMIITSDYIGDNVEYKEAFDHQTTIMDYNLLLEEISENWIVTN